MKIWHKLIIVAALVLPMLAGCTSLGYFQDRSEELKADLQTETAAINAAYGAGEITESEKDLRIREAIERYEAGLDDAAQTAETIWNTELEDSGEDVLWTIAEIGAILAGGGILSQQVIAAMRRRRQLGRVESEDPPAAP